jgi:nucleoside 2-deoxyribosyltransferase
VRVYLACTVRGDRGGVLAGRVVAERLQALGHEVLTSHLLDDEVERAEAALTEREVFERDIRWLSECDVVVAEASGSSYGVGFEVGYVLGRARETGQKVVLVYDQARSGAISRLIVGNHDSACATFGYQSLAELSAFIDQRFA